MHLEMAFTTCQIYQIREQGNIIFKAILQSGGNNLSMGGRGASKEQLTPGGFEEISYVTRFTPDTSFVMREDIRRSTSGGKTYLVVQ